MTLKLNCTHEDLAANRLRQATLLWVEMLLVLGIAGEAGAGQWTAEVRSGDGAAMALAKFNWNLNQL